MLKISRQGVESFHNMKCGEVFYVTPAVFNVYCCLCGSEMHLEQFSSHFQTQHLPLAEDVLKLMPKNKLEIDSSLLDHIPLKEEETADDVTKQELELSANWTQILEDEAEDDENKSLQELVNATKAKQKKINKQKKLKEDTVKKVLVSRKHCTRNAKSQEVVEEKIGDPLQTNDCDEDYLLTHLDVKKLSGIEVCCNQVDKDEDSNGEWSGLPELSAEEIDTEVDSDSHKNSKEALPFPCPLCGRSYRTKHGLQKHNHSVHNPSKQPRNPKQSKPQNKCEICNEVFRSIPVLRAHKFKHTGIFCDICGRSFTQVGHLKRHKIRHTGIKEFKCKECDKEFFTAKELKSHMVCHSSVMPVICEICGKGCRNVAVLKDHMRRHTGERPAKCDVCGKCFFTGHDLNVHAVAHTSERPFKCEICGSTFQRKKALRIHKRIHSNDRKHVCKICGKGFAQTGGLNSHLRTHDAAVEKSTTSGTNILSAVQVPPSIFLMDRGAEDNTQADTDVVIISRHIEDHVIDGYME